MPSSQTPCPSGGTHSRTSLRCTVLLPPIPHTMLMKLLGSGYDCVCWLGARRAKGEDRSRVWGRCTVLEGGRSSRESRLKFDRKKQTEKMEREGRLSP